MKNTIWDYFKLILLVGLPICVMLVIADCVISATNPKVITKTYVDKTYEQHIELAKEALDVADRTNLFNAKQSYALIAIAHIQMANEMKKKEW